MRGFGGLLEGLWGLFEESEGLSWRAQGFGVLFGGLWEVWGFFEVV